MSSALAIGMWLLLGLAEQATPVAGLLCIVLEGFGKIFVERHGLLRGSCGQCLAAVALTPVAAAGGKS